jgi:hypothetical protein
MEDSDVSEIGDIPASSNRPAGERYQFTFTSAERDVITLALGELLQSVRRDEHLIPTIQSLIERMKSAAPASGA